MYNQKLCLAVNGQFGKDTKSQIRLFRQAGFDAFFTSWSRGEPIDEYAAAAKETGMIYQSVHAPFNRSADMWHADDESANDAVAELEECVRACGKNSIDLMVCHAYIGFNDDRKPTEKGIQRFEKVINTASNYGVRIAFENTEGEEYLDALLTYFKGNDTVGFCFDSGHELCYNRSRDMLALYGDRLLCTHLNDNLGISNYNGDIFWTDDLHLLPFDGIADWNNIAQRLDKCGYNGILTFELNTLSKPGRHENDIYAKLSLEEYLAQAYTRACRVVSLRK